MSKAFSVGSEEFFFLSLPLSLPLKVLASLPLLVSWWESTGTSKGSGGT